MTCPNWHDVLDSFEAALHGQRAFLSGHADMTAPSFVQIDGLGPLPAELLPRARDLAAACAQLTAELESATDSARQELSRSTQPPSSSQPNFLNQHA